MGLSIAIVGAGVIGREHAARARACGRARLAAVVDPVSGADWGVTRYESVEAMLGAMRPDGAIVATPNHTHADVAVALLKAGVPVLVEKPVAGTVEDAGRIAAVARETGVAVLVGHHRRHSGYVRAAREAIAQGRLGRIVAVNATVLFYKPDAYFDVAWRRGPEGGPVLINLVHEVDTLRALVGEIVRVEARGSSSVRGYGVEDTAAVIVEFECGALGTILVSDTTVAARSWEQTAGENPRYARDASQDCLFLAGTQGSLAIPTMQLWRQEGEGSWDLPFVRETVAVAHADPLTVQFDHFLDVIEGKSAPVVGAADAGRTLSATLAIRSAIAASRWGS